MTRDTKEKKTTYKQKRLIAQCIAVGSMVTLLAGMTTGTIAAQIHQNEINKLKQDEKELYMQFMDSAEFSRYTDAQIIQLADEYTSSAINYGTFRKRLNEMFSIENAKEALEASNSEIKDDVAKINNEINACNEEYSKSAALTVSVGVIGASALTSALGFAAASIYDEKSTNENEIKSKTKNKTEKNIEGLVTTI